jgi:tetratricopeptide (TPR) repeat protein
VVTWVEGKPSSVHNIVRFAAGLLAPLRRRDPGACPSRRELDGFMRGQLAAAENLRVLRHLLPGCRPCQEITAALWWAGAGRRPVRETGPALDHGPAVDRVYDRVRRIHSGLERERAAARQLLAPLAGLPPAVWIARLAGEPRTWGLCELLLERSRAARGSAPRDAEAIAGCAVAVAAAIPPGSHPARLCEDLTARAWIAVAEARRAGEDLAGAEEALERAGLHLLRGSGERLEKARLYGVRAALRSAQGRYPEAGRLLYRALVVYRRTGQADLLGRAFVQLGYVRACAGDLAGAVVALRQGLALADATRDPEIALAAVFILGQGERLREAAVRGRR